MTALSQTDPAVRPTLGELTDYRVEIQLATARALDMRNNPDAVFTGSVIDNYAYNSVRHLDFTRANLHDEAADVRFRLTAAILYAILIDSFEADVLAFLPYKFGSVGEFDSRVENEYKMVFDHFSMTPIELRGTLEENVQVLSDEIKRLEKEAHGEGSDSEDSAKEESE